MSVALGIVKCDVARLKEYQEGIVNCFDSILVEMLICWAIIEDCFANMIQDSPKDESSVLKAVQNVHATIDKEIAAGTDPNNVFVCGFSQGGLSLNPCT